MRAAAHVDAAAPHSARAARRRPRKWPSVLLTLAYAGTLRGAKPSPYPHVWDEEPGAGSWAGEIVHDVDGLDPQDAPYWVFVLLAMPWSMQAHFFSLRCAAHRQAWFAAHADPTQAPEFLHARSLFMSERSRLVRFVRSLPPPLSGAGE